jgi:hypothetical protein
MKEGWFLPGALESIPSRQHQKKGRKPWQRRDFPESKGGIVMERRHTRTLAIAMVFILALLWGAVGFSQDAAKSSNVITYEKALKAGMPILVNVSSPTWGGCKRLSSTVRETESEFKGKIAFVYLVLDVPGEKALAEKLGSPTPTTLIFISKGGKVLEVKKGQQEKEALTQSLTRLSK